MTHATILQTLFWEHWRRTWKMLALGIVAGLSLLLYAKGLAEEPGDFERGARVAIGLAQIVALGGLIYSFDKGDRLTCGLPRMALRLPVPIMYPVLARVLFNAAAIAAVTLLLLLPTALYGAEDVQPVEAVGHALILVAIVQFVSLALSRLGDWTVGVLMVVTAVMLGVGIPAAEWWFAPYGLSPSLSVLATGIAITGVCVVADWAVVGIQRRGGFSGSDPLARARAWWAMRTDRGRPFASPDAAQRWMERRLVAGLLTKIGIVMTVGLVAYFGLSGGGTVFSYDATFTELGAALCLATFWGTVASTGALTMFLRFQALNGSSRVFLFARPVETRRLARARALGTFVPVLVFSGIATAVLFFLNNPGMAWLFDLSAGELAYGALEWALVFVAFASLAWVASWSLNLVVAGFCLTTIPAILGQPWGRGGGEAEFGVLLALTLAMAAFVLAVRAKHLSILRLVVVIAMGAGCALVTNRIFELDNLIDGRYSGRLTVERIALFAMLIALPIATTPLVLDRFRHR